MQTVITSSAGKPTCIYCVLEAMRTYGGAFVKALGQLWWQADQINKAKILATWPDYFREYANTAKGQCRHGAID